PAPNPPKSHPQRAHPSAPPRRHFIPQSTPSRGHDPDVAADCPRLSNPHSSIAPRRSTHAGPQFPPSRLFGRLPPCIPSRRRLAGIRKPLLKKPDLLHDANRASKKLRQRLSRTTEIKPVIVLTSAVISVGFRPKVGSTSSGGAER